MLITFFRPDSIYQLIAEVFIIIIIILKYLKIELIGTFYSDVLI